MSSSTSKIPKGMVGAYIRVSGAPEYTVIYKSMVELWKNRSKHKVFIVNQHLNGAVYGLSALHKYCQNTNINRLLIDVHKCTPGCKEEPDILEAEEIDLGKIRCPNSQICWTHGINENDTNDCCIVLDATMYESLVDMAKMGLAGVYHHMVPLQWNSVKMRLESIYGDIWYKSNNTD